MKKILIAVLLVIFTVSSAFALKIYIFSGKPVYKDSTGISYIAKTDQSYLYTYDGRKWEKQFIKGVNIGAAKPGYFPGEFGITKEDYLRWFEYIGEMNANTIRVYTILKPEFYNALYEYNSSSDKPLYLMQGVWVNEEDISSLMNAHDSKIKDSFKNDIKQIIDVIHGRAIIPKKQGYASGVYKKDISPYVSGFVLGIEWDPEFVLETNRKNPEKLNYAGKYLYTEGASPFEVFLCEAGDYAAAYETEAYKMQRPISFTNWVTTDMLDHPNEPLENEDMATVNTEHIKPKPAFKPGLFASYHIYPYYPDSMNYQREYAAFKDEEGKANPYRAYLRDLKKEHTVPVLVAEFGIPASRGAAHLNIHTGLNQGNVDEKQQGEMNASMLKDIYKEGYAGGLVFSWQDEWFKRTWNTMDLDTADRRPYWSNPQTNEQEFGLLAFDPGAERSVSYVDGDLSEWKNDKPVTSSEKLKVYAKYDEKYLYLMAETADFDFEKDSLLIPIDTIKNQGSKSASEYGVNLERAADFLIAIKGKDESRILVHSYYDSFYYLYSKVLGMVEGNPDLERKDSTAFNRQYLCLNKELFLPEDRISLPLSKYETGKLTYGNGNPNSQDYSSLADFIVSGNNVEIRIPWQLLNVMDPSEKTIMNDLYIDGIKPLRAESFFIEAQVIGETGVTEKSSGGEFTWDEWDLPTYHERLKPSYYILQEAFGNIDKK